MSLSEKIKAAAQKMNDSRAEKLSSKSVATKEKARGSSGNKATKLYQKSTNQANKATKLEARPLIKMLKSGDDEKKKAPKKPKKDIKLGHYNKSAFTNKPADWRDITIKRKKG